MLPTRRVGSAWSDPFDLVSRDFDQMLNRYFTQLENGVLTIAAERGPAEAKGEQHLSERRYTRVSRSFMLPKTIDENKVDAKLADGVLSLTLHKRDEVKPRQIEVK